jgi:hypothetical protein
MISRTTSRMLTTQKAQSALAWSSVFCGRQDSLIEGHALSKPVYAANPEGAT